MRARSLLLAALVAIHRASASCGVVAVAVETYRGARVENYDPVFEYLKNDALGALRRSEGYEKEYLSNAAEKTSSIASTIRSARLSLASRCRRLCLALIDSHEKVAGASAGPAGARPAPDPRRPHAPPPDTSIYRGPVGRRPVGRDM